MAVTAPSRIAENPDKSLGQGFLGADHRVEPEPDGVHDDDGLADLLHHRAEDEADARRDQHGGQIPGVLERHRRTVLQEDVAKDAAAQAGGHGKRDQACEGEPSAHRVKRAAQASKEHGGQVEIEGNRHRIVHEPESITRAPTALRVCRLDSLRILAAWLPQDFDSSATNSSTSR